MHRTIYSEFLSKVNCFESGRYIRGQVAATARSLTSVTQPHPEILAQSFGDLPDVVWREYIIIPV